MSFWDRLGAVAEKSLEIGTGGAFGLAWDIARNSDDDGSARHQAEVLGKQLQGQSFFGKVGTLGAATLDHAFGSSVAGGISSAFGHDLSAGDLSKPMSYGVMRPLSTFGQVLGQQHDKTSFAGAEPLFSQDAWRQAWNRSGGDGTTEGLSPGQVLSSNVLSDAPFDVGQVRGAARFDPGTADEREDFFHHTWVGRLSSGTVDLALNWYADPLVLAGKGGAAVNAAHSTVKAADRAGALGVAVAGAKAGDATRGANRAGLQLNKMFEQTDNMTASEMLQLPQFRAVPDAAPLAYLFEDANKLTDKSARYTAKADLFGVALGDAGAIGRVSQDMNQAQKWKRLLDTPETSEAASRFSFSDAGKAEFDYLNSQINLDEIEQGVADELSGQVSRMERLLDQQNVSNVTGKKLGQGLTTGVRLNRVRETMYHGGPANRPIRFITGMAGARVPGYVNTVDTTAGHAELSQLLGRADFMHPERRKMYLQEYLGAETREDRARVLWRVENGLFRAAGENYGVDRNTMDFLLTQASGVRKTWADSLRSRVYSGAPDANHVVGAIDPDGVANVYSRPFLKSQIEDAVGITDPRILKKVLSRDANRKALGIAARAKTLGADLSDPLVDMSHKILHPALRAWKFAALLRPAYITRIQVDTQLRLMSAMGGMAYAAGLKENGVGKLLMTMRPTLAFNPRFDTKGMEAVEASTAKRMFMRGDDALRPARTEEEAVKLGESLRGSQGADTVLTDQTSKDLYNLRTSGDWTVLDGRDPKWEQAYLRAVNHQIRNSPTAKAMLLSDDEDAFMAAFRSDKHMQAEWRNFRDMYDSPEEWLASVRAHVDHTLGDDALKATAHERELTSADLREYMPDRHNRPTVHGESYVPFRTGELGKMYGQFRDWWFRFASDAPENIMGRHPLYNHSFRQNMVRMVGSHEGELTDDALMTYRKSADRLARKEVADTLFDVSRSSQMSQSAALFAPFFSAWEDTMKKWGKLFYDNPDRAMRFQQAWMVPNDLGWVRDSNGNRIDSEGRVFNQKGEKVAKEDRGEGEYIVLPTRFLKGVTGADSLKFRKDNFNLVFQGEHWWLPGTGPLAQVPVNEITLKMFPEKADNPILKAVLPFGPTSDSVKSQFMPSWWKQVGNAFGDSQDHSNTFSMLMAQELSKYNAGKRDKEPTMAEITKKTRNWYILRALMSSSAPVTATPNPEYQLYIDEAHRYRDQDKEIRAQYTKWQSSGREGAEPPRDWQEKFYNDYPDYFEMSVSLSANDTGIQATAKAFDAIKRYRKEIAENPEYGWMFVGPDNEPGFDQGVYAWQKATSVAPGSSQKFRGQTDPIDARAKIEASRGWLEYQKAQTRLSLELEKRGLHSFSQKGAEDLNELRKGYIDFLREGNPSWSRDYDTRDSGKARSLMQVAQKAMKGNKSLADRSDMKALKDYMDARGKIRAALAARDVKSLDNPANADLADLWGGYTRFLISENPGFEQMWSRALEADDLNQSIGGD